MEINIHENRVVGLTVTFICGMLDSFTYVNDGVFSCAQTGNLLLAIVNLNEGNWELFIKKLTSTLFFFVGIMLAKFMVTYFKQKKNHFWRIQLLYFEAMFFFLLNLAFFTKHPTMGTVLISLVTAIQWGVFDKIEGMGYTNVFITGNLKEVAANLYDVLWGENPQAKSRLIHYSLVVTAFLSGATISVFLSDFFGRDLLWLVSGLFFMLATSQMFRVKYFISKGF